MYICIYIYIYIYMAARRHRGGRGSVVDRRLVESVSNHGPGLIGAACLDRRRSPPFEGSNAVICTLPNAATTRRRQCEGAGVGNRVKVHGHTWHSTGWARLPPRPTHPVLATPGPTVVNRHFRLVGSSRRRDGRAASSTLPTCSGGSIRSLRRPRGP